MLSPTGRGEMNLVLAARFAREFCRRGFAKIVSRPVVAARSPDGAERNPGMIVAL